MNHTPESGTTSRIPLEEEDFEDSDLARRFIQVNLQSPEPDCLDAGSSFARALANSAIEVGTVDSREILMLFIAHPARR